MFKIGDFSKLSRVSVKALRLYDELGLLKPAKVDHFSGYRHGSFAALSEAYNALTQWIEANAYRITGPNREVYLQYDRDGSPDDFVTEIQFPVAKV